MTIVRTVFGKTPKTLILPMARRGRSGAETLKIRNQAEKLSELLRVTKSRKSMNKIYNHDIMHCTHAQVMGNHLYSGRVLGTSEPGDIVQLHPELKPEWEAIVAHYDRIGLSHSTNVIWDVSLKIIEDYPTYAPSVFYFGDADHSHGLDDGWFKNIDKEWYEVVDYINSKNNFMALAKQLDVPIPHTECFEHKGAVNLNNGYSYPCYVKPAVSVDGMGIIRCEDEADLEKALANSSDDVPLQIQEEISTQTFLNLQYRVTPDGLERLACTEQILDNCSHVGNRYPTSYEPWDKVEPIAQWMAQRGMKEIFAFDVAVVPSDGGNRYLSLECNPRFNGASYPTGIAKKLKLDSWAGETFSTKFRHLQDLDIKDLEFDSSRGTGIVLVNWGSILLGKIVILLVGTIEEQDELRMKLKTRLSA